MANKDFFIVGIGASAGGYEALKQFFAKIPEKPGVAFVLIMHLSREHKSLAQDWVAKFTKMKVVTVREDIDTEPDIIYLMPENKTLKMNGRRLILGSHEVVNLAIDIFFHSLGKELKEKSVGIILSGTGTDGSRGILTIKEHGGAVLVQQPNSAGFDGMPNVAIATGHPDLILPPGKLAEGLLEYIENPASIDDDGLEETSATDKEMVDDIIGHVSEYSKVNFRGYKINTILRRIEKRTKLNHLNTLAEYHKFTKHNPQEILALYNSLLEKREVVDEFPKDASSYKKVEELELELRLTKKELRFAIDELETLNEEMQASNEELHSSNKELQSANEEMQSSNEELHTVNIELQQKLDEISSLNNDINNLVNNTQIAIIFLDENLNIRMFTPAAKRNFNFMENDMGRPLSHLTHNFLNSQFLEDTKKVLHNHQPTEREVEDSNGNFYLLRVLPYKVDERHVKGVVVTFISITQLKGATDDLRIRKAELEESEQNWKSLVNNTPDIIVRYDGDLNYISVNEAMEKLLGLPASEIMGKSNTEIAIPNEGEEVKRWINCVEQTLKTGKACHAFFDNTDGSPTTHYYSSFVPEFFPDGKRVQSVLSISRDVTRLKDHENLIENQNKQLKKANTDLDNFIYTASHDLRTPIANIEGLTKILNMKLEGKIGDTEKSLMEMMGKSIGKFKSTISDLTEISKAQNNIGYQKEDISFKDVLEDVKTDIQELITESGARIWEDLQVDIVTYARHNLRSIFLNLLSNAIKYRSNRPVEIWVQTFREGNAVVLRVADNGLGINPSQQGKMFEMFKRLHTHVEGTGIGLYIVKRIIENNGGKIEVESELDKGTAFKVYLKL